MTLNDLFRMTLDDRSAAWQMERILDGLSKWWIRSEYYEAIGSAWERPPLPTEGGFCPILLQVKDWNERRICRRGLILPVRWVEKTSPAGGGGQSKKLPSALLKLAERVQKKLSEEGAEKEASQERKNRWNRLDQWELVPTMERFPDLSALPDETFSWESAAIPLAATLLLTAVDEEVPKSGVFGSGAWDFGKSHMKQIAGIREKRDTVADWGGSLLFLPEEGFLDVSFDELQAESNRPDCPKIKTLPSGRRTLRETVDLYRRALCREPEENDPEKCAHYYQQMPNDPAELQDFYRRRLADVVAAKCREKAEKRYPDTITRLDKGTLVTWVSTGTELVNVAVKCFHLQKIVLLYTPSMEKPMQNCCQSLPDRITVESVVYEGEMRFDKLTTFLKEQFARFKGEMTAEETILADLTLGTVVMSLALHEAAPEGAALLYWYKKQDKNNRIEPLSTEPEIRIKK